MNEQTTSSYSSYPKWLNPFNIAYAVSALIQIIGTWSFFGEIGGGGARGFFYSVSGAICLELMILALNFYGKEKAGFFRLCLVVASLTLISASATIQIFDIRIAHPSDMIVALLGPYLPLARVMVAIVPSVAMGIITVIKFFGDKGDAVTAIDALTLKVKELDVIIARRDSEILDLSAHLEEARNRPIVQQLIADSKEVHTKVALPEPAQMPIALISDGEIDRYLSSPEVNAFMRQQLEMGMNHNDICRAALAHVGIMERPDRRIDAERAASYDKRFNKLYARVRRWQM